MLRFFLSHVLVFGSACSHVWYYVFGYALPRYTGLHACSMLLCLCPCQSHACTLGFAFSHALMFTSTFLDVCPHANMHISMLICVDQCVYMLRSMFSTCFMPSSMFSTCFMPSSLCHHLCLGLVRHAKCYCSPFVPFIAFSCVLA